MGRAAEASSNENDICHWNPEYSFLEKFITCHFAWQLWNGTGRLKIQD